MMRLKQNCSDTCDCQTTVIARYTTNRDNPIWDLTPYQGAGVGKPNTYWRLWERSGELEYNRGEIDANGTLVGLPSQFVSEYYYDGFMELQQGCPNPCCAVYSCWDEISWPS